MDYDQFDVQYGHVLDAARVLDASTLAGQLDKLREMAATIEDPADRHAAELLLASLEDALGNTRPELSEAMARAVRVHARARDEEGTAAERIDRARAGIAEIGRIAAAAEPAEQGAILDLNESLQLLVEALEISPGNNHR